MWLGAARSSGGEARPKPSLALRRVPLSALLLPRVAARRGRPCRPVPSTRPRTFGNARAHGRALPPPPQPAPVRHGRGRSVGSNFGRLARSGLFALLVVRVIGARLRLRVVGGLEVHCAHLAAVVLLQIIADALI